MHGSKLNQEATASYSHSFSVKVVDEFFSQHNGISGQQIVSLTPIRQVNFFILKELFDEWHEETKKFNSPFFDYRNEEVSQALKLLANTLSKNILIQKKDFLPLLERAVSGTLLLLLDPKVYFQNEMKKYKSSNKLMELKTNGKYIKLYKPLFDQLVKSFDDNSSIDSTLLISAGVADFDGESEGQNEIIGLFNKVLKLDVVEKQKPSSSIKKTIPDLTNENLNGVSEPVPEISDDFDKEFVPLEAKTPKESAKNINEQYSDDVQTLNQRYEESEKIETVAAAHETKSMSDLKSNISINQRYMFVNDLFEGNDEDYEIAIGEVENCGSFDTSVELLVQKYSRKYAWDMNSDEVKELLKVIFKIFR